MDEEEMKVKTPGEWANEGIKVEKKAWASWSPKAEGNHSSGHLKINEKYAEWQWKERRVCC